MYTAVVITHGHMVYQLQTTSPTGALACMFGLLASALRDGQTPKSIVITDAHDTVLLSQGNMPASRYVLAP